MSLFLRPSVKPKVLLLSAHTDDCELGMGATIARLMRLGCDIQWLTFCNAWQSLPEGFDKDVLLREQIAAAAAYGIPEENVEILDIPVRHFPQYRQDILEALVAKGRAFQPDLVFCPSLQDRHQDHLTLAQEAERAFKRKTLLGYILPWNISAEIRTCFIEVDQSDLDTQVKALSCYDSQAHRQYFQQDALATMLKANGFKSGYTLAEAFETIRLNAPL